MYLNEIMNQLNEECNIISTKKDSICIGKIFDDQFLIINDIDSFFTNGSENSKKFYLERGISSDLFDALNYNSKFTHFDTRAIQYLNCLTGLICVFDSYVIPVVTKGSVPNNPDFYYNRYFYSSILDESDMRNYKPRDEIYHEYEGYLYCSFFVLAIENPQLRLDGSIGTILWVSKLDL